MSTHTLTVAPTLFSRAVIPTGSAQAEPISIFDEHLEGAISTDPKSQLYRYQVIV